MKKCEDPSILARPHIHQRNIRRRRRHGGKEGAHNATIAIRDRRANFYSQYEAGWLGARQYYWPSNRKPTLPSSVKFIVLLGLSPTEYDDTRISLYFA